MRISKYWMIFLVSALCWSAEARADADESAKQLALGTEFYQQGKFPEAAQAFRRAYELGKNAQALYNLARTETEMKQYGLAADHYDTYLREGGSRIRTEMKTAVTTEISRLRGLQGETRPTPTSTSPASAGAAKQTDSQLADYKKAAELYKSGQVAYQKGDLARAKSDFGQSYRLYAYHECLYFLAKIESRQGNIDGANQLFEQYLREGGARISPQMRQDVAAEQGRMVQGAEQKTKMAELERLQKEGAEWMRQKEYAQALETYNQAYSVSPSPYAVFGMAQALENLQRNTEALAAYQRFLQEGGGKITPQTQTAAQQGIDRLNRLVAAEQQQAEAERQYQVGSAQLQAQKYQEAITAFEQSDLLVPSARTMYGVGEANIGLGKWAEAAAAFRKFLARGKKNTAEEERKAAERKITWLDTVQRASSLYSEGSYKGAAAAFEKACQTDPVPDLLYYWAKSLTELKENGLAMEKYRELLETGEGKILKSRLLEAKSEIDRLQEMVDDAARETEARMLLEEARQDIKNQDYEIALSKLAESNKIHGSYEVYYEVGVCQAGSKRYALARKSFEKYLEDGATLIPTKRRLEVADEISRLITLEKQQIDRIKAVGFNNKGLMLNQKKKFAEAMGEFERAYQICPDYRILSGMARAASGQYKYDLSIETYKRYLQEGGAAVADFRRAWVETRITNLTAANEAAKRRAESVEKFQSAKSMAAEGNLEKAITEYQKAYELNPNYKIIFRIAEAQARLLKYEDAIASYSRYLEEGGEKVSSKQRNDVGKALLDLEKAMQSIANKERAGVLYKSGKTLMQKKKWDEAIVEIEQSYALDANHDVLLDLSTCYEKLKEYQKAINQLDAYLKKGGDKIPEAKRVVAQRNMDRLLNMIEIK